MQINLVVSPLGTEADPPYGYTPMDVGIEITLYSNGKSFVQLKPTEVDGKTRKRMWLPDIPRTSGIAPIVGSDKLDYYHPTRKPEAYAATIEVLEQNCQEIPELQLVLNWMRSNYPLELELEIATQPKADAITLETGRIVWRLEDGTYIHNVPKVQSAHAAQTLKRAGGDGDLVGALPKIHTKKLATPLFGCNDNMFRSWGQSDKQALNISAESATIATQRYTQLLETKGHHLRVGSERYWVWGALPEMAEVSEANKGLAAYFTRSESADIDPVAELDRIVGEVATGAKSAGKAPADLKIACGYIGIGGSGKGRAASGQMTEVPAIELLNHLLVYHQKQRRYLTRSTPYWVFGFLTGAEGSSKKAAEKANAQIFEAMMGGYSPPPAITNAIVERLKIEGIPNIQKQKSNREWAQIAYLTWIAPDYIKHNEIMKPKTEPENLLAWHVGRVFSACKTMAYHYAARSGEPAKGWRNPLDSYRQTLFSSPAQGFAQVMAKVSPYLLARSDKAFWFHKTVAEMGEDCCGMSPPKRWTDEQAFFFALGISELAKLTSKSSDGIDESPSDEES